MEDPVAAADGRVRAVTAQDFSRLFFYFFFHFFLLGVPKKTAFLQGTVMVPFLHRDMVPFFVDSFF